MLFVDFSVNVDFSSGERGGSVIRFYHLQQW
jgi:hypothetical protein